MKVKEEEEGIEGKEKIYDRQIRLWGVEAQNKMMNSNVLIIGLNGINIEACKNLVLSGINITIIDDNIVSHEYVENNFFINEEDIGSPVCEVIFKELKTINKFIKIEAFIGKMDTECDEITLDAKVIHEIDKTQEKDKITQVEFRKRVSMNLFIRQFTSVCVSCEDYPLYMLTNLNTICRDINVGFSGTMCNGKFAFLFSDFMNHTVEESYYKKNTEPIKVEYCRLLDFFNSSCNKFPKRTNPIIYGMYALVHFEQKKKYTKENMKIDEKEFTEFCKEYLVNEEDIKEIIKMYKIPFSPSFSLLGGVTTQEIRKFLSKQHEPIPNFCVFDMNQNVVCTAMIK